MRFIKNSFVISLFLLLFVFLNILVQPKYQTNLIEGSLTEEYYKSDKYHDVIFLGDCELYANISPMVLYEESGITSFIRGNSQQLIWQSYYLLKETLQYEKPKVVVFSVNAMRYDKPVNEAYHRLMFDTMKWSKEKIEAIQVSMTDEETFLSYLFPILRYHSRIFELTEEDFKYLFSKKENTHNGFLINKEVKPLETLPSKKPLEVSQFSKDNYEYLDKIRELCEENNIKLVLVKAPSLYPYWPIEYETQIKEYASKYYLDYYNFLENITDIGLDYKQDTYDGGLHLNLSGATKLSIFFAPILKEKYELTDYREVEDIANIYNQKLQKYKEEIGEGNK